MEGYLIKTSEVWRVPNQEVADEMEEVLRQDNQFQLQKWTKVEKQRKQQGEVVDEWVQVTCVRVFNDEKEPDNDVKPVYN